MSATSLIGLVLLVVLAFALQAWAIWVARRQKSAVYRIASVAVLPGLLLGVGAVVWTLREVARAHQVAETASAHEAAEQLASGISAAVVGGAIGATVSNLILLAILVLLCIGTSRPPTRPQGS